MTMFDSLLVSKARRPKFELTFRIVDLNNVPLVTGTSYVKWHLPASTSAEHRGRTEKAPIKEHKVFWEYVRTITVRLTIDKSNSLQETIIDFEVLQDYGPHGRAEKITLGHVSLNLAEYVEESEDGEEGVTRRYLMQESKINSTLKIGIAMKQVDGEKTFLTPPLKTAPVFGGIAGIMAGEQDVQDDVGNMPMINRSRDHGELQDMYRRALAASWASNNAELPADQCIEDIFDGGDGWKHLPNTLKSTPRIGMHNEDSDESRRGHHGHYNHHNHHRTGSATSSKSQNTVTAKRNSPRIGIGHKRNESEGLKESPSAQSVGASSTDSERGRQGYKQVREVDEFEVRDDLVAWRLPIKVRQR